MFERILFGSLRFSANWFFHCPVNCWFKYYSSSSVSGRIYNSSPNPRIQTMPFIFTHIGISCLIVMDIISMFFSYFPLFSEADSSQGGPQDRHVESSHSSQVCRGSHLRLHVRRGHRSNTPPAATHCHTLCLGKRRTAPAEGAIGQSRDNPVNSQG